MQGKAWYKYLLSLPPMAYLLIFFAAPTFIMLFASFRYAGEYGGLAPWYLHEGGRLTLDLTLENWQRLLETDIYLRLFLKSIGYAVVTTLLCMVMGYPLALMIARSGRKHRDLLLLLVILPFWSNFLVRIYAWMIIFSPAGALTRMLNGALDLFGIGPVTLMYSPTAMLVCLVYVHLPFMVLPLYANLEKHDIDLLDAAQDHQKRGTGRKPACPATAATGGPLYESSGYIGQYGTRHARSVHRRHTFHQPTLTANSSGESTAT